MVQFWGIIFRFGITCIRCSATGQCMWDQLQINSSASVRGNEGTSSGSLMCFWKFLNNYGAQLMYKSDDTHLINNPSVVHLQWDAKVVANLQIRWWKLLKVAALMQSSYTWLADPHSCNSMTRTLQINLFTLCSMRQKLCNRIHWNPLNDCEQLATTASPDTCQPLAAFDWPTLEVRKPSWGCAGRGRRTHGASNRNQIAAGAAFSAFSSKCVNRMSSVVWTDMFTLANINTRAALWCTSAFSLAISGSALTSCSLMFKPLVHFLMRMFRIIDLSWKKSSYIVYVTKNLIFSLAYFHHVSPLLLH